MPTTFFFLFDGSPGYVSRGCYLGWALGRRAKSPELVVDVQPNPLHSIHNYK